MQKRLECIVYGRVQLVMFRDFVTRKARGLGITGTVKNSPDGTVLVVAEGGEEELQKLLTLIHKGSALSRVDRVEEFWKPYLGEFKTFVILY
jgi:acylphosphatase